MTLTKQLGLWARRFSENGMLVVLALISAYYSWATLKLQGAAGAAGAEQISLWVRDHHSPGTSLLVAAGALPEDREFAGLLESSLVARGYVVRIAQGAPSAARQALAAMVGEGKPPAAILCSASAAVWSDEVFSAAPAQPRRYPQEYWWPDFLKRDNLLNVANQIAIIAILAIGMTLVIISGGIDLSVGSLLALGSVVVALLLERWGGESAGLAAQTGAVLVTLLICAVAGAGSGLLVAALELPAFIVTLAAMLIASGVAYKLTGGESVFHMPPAFRELAHAQVPLPGLSWGLPLMVVIMCVLYFAAHFMMKRTALGRNIYAVGGNAEAARLCGVPVGQVRVLVFALCGLLAGFGGVLQTSLLMSGSPTYGFQIELMVIASVVVGGTSIFGGTGRIFGTLTGAFIIAVIQNGMNLTGLSGFDQNIVLGTVILLAVLLDRVKSRMLGE